MALVERARKPKFWEIRGGSSGRGYSELLDREALRTELRQRPATFELASNGVVPADWERVSPETWVLRTEDL